MRIEAQRCAGDLLHRSVDQVVLAEAQRRAVVYSAMVMLGMHGLEQLAKALGKVDNT